MKKPKRILTLHQLRVITLRRASMRWKYKYQALNEAKVRVEIGKFKNGNTQYGIFYKCAECVRKGKKVHYYTRKEVSVDHISPVVDTEDGFVGWDTYVPNLLCEVSNLQVLCRTPCHKEKTARENEERAKSSGALIKKEKKKLDKVSK